MCNKCMKYLNNERKWKLYVHINKINGKRYYGITSTSVNKRWKNGKGYKFWIDEEGKRHGNKHFWNSICKYGWNSFEHIVLFEELTENEVKLMEKFYIALYGTRNPNKGYNETNGGDGTCGVKISEERKQYLSETMTGEGNPFYGKSHTEESKQKNREAHLGLNCGEDNPNSTKIVCLNTREIFGSMSEAIQKYELPQGSLSECCNHNENNRKSCGKHPITNESLAWRKYEDYINMTEEEIKNAIEEAIKSKARENHGRATKVVCLNNREIFNCIEDILDKYEINDTSNIITCCTNNSSHCGKLNGEPLVWRYYKDYINMTEEEINNILEEVMEQFDKRVILLNTGEIFDTPTKGANTYNCDNSSVTKCCNGRMKSAGKDENGNKLIWRYYRKYLKEQNNNA